MYMYICIYIYIYTYRSLTETILDPKPYQPFVSLEVSVFYATWLRSWP